MPAVYQSTTYTIKNTDDVVVFNGSVPSLFYLPQAVGSGKVLVVKNAGNASLSIMARGNDLVENATYFPIQTSEAYTVVDAKSSFWDVVGSFSTSTQSVPSSTRETSTASTSSLAAGATGNISINLAKSSDLISLATDHPAWVRVYSTSAARTADASRAITTDPTPGSGVVLDVLTTSGALIIDLSPAPFFANGDAPATSTAYLAVTNYDTVSRAITVTLTHLPQEV